MRRRPRGARPSRAVTIATLGGVGRLPIAPGTWGSAAALVLLLPLRGAAPEAWATVLAALGAVAVWSAGAAAKTMRATDPGVVVIDEVFGMGLVMAALPAAGWWPPVAGFLLFRVFDVLKPPPLRALERLPGGWGIVADDAGAGLYTVAALALLGAV